MKGSDLIKFIQENHLEDALVTVTATMYYETMYYEGDHDCITTDDVSLDSGDYNGNTSIVFYVDFSLY